MMPPESRDQIRAVTRAVTATRARHRPLKNLNHGTAGSGLTVAWPGAAAAPGFPRDVSGRRRWRVTLARYMMITVTIGVTDRPSHGAAGRRGPLINCQPFRVCLLSLKGESAFSEACLATTSAISRDPEDICKVRVTSPGRTD